MLSMYTSQTYSRSSRRQNPLVEVPTSKNLSVLQQEWYLLQATISPAAHAERLRWAVAMCWEAYIETRIDAHFPCKSHDLRDDLRQAGLLGAYNAARRYRVDGCWVPCIKVGIVEALSSEVHHDQSGAWLGKPSRQSLHRLLQVQTRNPQSSLHDAAIMAGLCPKVAKLILTCSERPDALHLPPTSSEADQKLPLREMIADKDALSESHLNEAIDHSTNLSKLREEVAALPKLQRNLLIDHWGLSGKSPVGLRRLSRKHRISIDAVQRNLDALHAHLRAVLIDNTDQHFQAHTNYVLQRLVYDSYDNTYLTWREVARDFELASTEEAMSYANEHAHRHRLPRLYNQDHKRELLQTQVRNEDCYQLAATGHTWPEVARISGVDDAEQAARHARTFACRARNPIRLREAHV